MSGGVDSSVAALLLKKQGYDCAGVFIRSYNLDGCAARDARDARLVAQKIGIPFYVWDFEKEYKKKVVDYMVRGYRRGITPNPDVMCNKEIKFGLFLEKALKLGAEYIATGHYAKIAKSKSRIANRDNKKSFAIGYKLFAARDASKDQSYFLWTLTRERLRHCLFPIGDYLKPEVRALARKAGLPTAEKKDSQGICFLGKVSLADFLKKRIRPKSGWVLNSAGKPVGIHDGSYFYTIGQRHGLNLGNKNKELRIKGKTETEPYYVAEKDAKANTITVAEGADNPALYRKEIFLGNVNFTNQNPPALIRANSRIDVFARVRYRQPLAEASIRRPRSRASSLRGRQESSIKLIFDKPQKFVAPGQSAVFYSKKGELLGGGVILSCG